MDVRRLIRKLKQEGWEIREGTKHFKAIAPNGEWVAISRRIHSPRRMRNTLAAVQRTGRKAE